MKKGLRESNPERYAKLNKPYPETAMADAAVHQFFEGVGKLREELGIPDVFMVLRIPYVSDDNVPREALLPLSYGDERNMEALAAMGYGWAAKCRQDMITSIVAQSGGIMKPQGSGG